MNGSAARLRIRSLLVCEDIRREDNGKELLLGVFSGVITAPNVPLKLPRIGVRIEAQVQSGEIAGPTEVLIFGPDRKLAIRVEGELPAASALGAVPFSFSFTMGPITFEREGRYVVRWKVAGHEHRAGDFFVSMRRHGRREAIGHAKPVAADAGQGTATHSP